MITADTRRKFINAIGLAFLDKPFTEERDGELIAIVWEGDGLTAGAAINADEAWVWLADAVAPARSAEEAINLLNTIFHDEIVAVAAYEQGVMHGCALANATNLHRPPHLLVPIDPRQVVRVKELHVRSWSGARDCIRDCAEDQ